MSSSFYVVFQPLWRANIPHCLAVHKLKEMREGLVNPHWLVRGSIDLSVYLSFCLFRNLFSIVVDLFVCLPVSLFVCLSGWLAGLGWLSWVLTGRLNGRSVVFLPNDKSVSPFSTGLSSDYLIFIRFDFFRSVCSWIKERLMIHLGASHSKSFFSTAFCHMHATL